MSRCYRLGRWSIVVGHPRRADMRTWFSVSPVRHGDTDATIGITVFGPRHGIIVVDDKRARW